MALAPADATVARIVGYHNVRSGVVGTDGTVRCGAVDLGINGTAAPGPVTVAGGPPAWSSDRPAEAAYWLLCGR